MDAILRVLRQTPGCSARIQAGRRAPRPLGHNAPDKVERNGQYRHGERTKGAIAERQKFSALLKMLRARLT
jgi:hypothetical protein